MSYVIALINQKGGVGKTTTAVNLAASLAATRRRVLLIDMDPQGNATMGSGVEKNDLQHSIYEAMVGKAELDAVCCKGLDAGYDLLPANSDLTAAEVELLSMSMKEYRLRYLLAHVRKQYDYVLIDCPPALNMLTVNAMAAAQGVIIPVQCEYYALEGLAALLNTIRQVQKTVNEGLKIEGLLRTMYDGRNSLSREVSGQLSAHFGDQLFRTLIPRNVRLAEAPSHGMPVITYDRQSKGSIAYLALAGELLRKSDASVTTAEVAA